MGLARVAALVRLAVIKVLRCMGSVLLKNCGIVAKLVFTQKARAD
jgi:hypothetical protein